MYPKITTVWFTTVCFLLLFTLVGCGAAAPPPKVVAVQPATAPPIKVSTPSNAAAPTNTATPIPPQIPTDTPTPAPKPTDVPKPTDTPTHPPAPQGFSCANVTEIPQAECNALVALYNSTQGANWKDKTGWLQTNEPCLWTSVSCLDNSTTPSGHVIGLYLSDNNLNGPLPAEIGDLTQLKYFTPYSNPNLNGPLPQSMTNLTRMEQLVISDTGLCVPTDTTFQAWFGKYKQGMGKWVSCGN